MSGFLAEASDTKEMVIEEEALLSLGPVFARHFAGRPAAIIADAATEAAAGRTVRERLAAAGVPIAPGLVFPAGGALHAAWEHVETIRSVLADGDAVAVAVGAGTINDMVKLASGQLDRPYAAVATAASMDGYAAYGASILRDGVKQTFACPAPRVIIADPAIVAAAPRWLAAAGYGDLIAKVVSGADWILADLLGIEVIEPRSWRLSQTGLKQWVGDPAGVAAGDPHACGQLLFGLICSGLAMQIARSSRPASGAEHQFSHLWDMQGCGLHVPHGIKVGVGSVISDAFYHRLLREGIPGQVPDRRLDGEVPTGLHALPALRDLAERESAAKRCLPGESARRVAALRAGWPSIRARLEDQLLPVGRLRANLLAAGAPVEMRDIGIADDLHTACRQARSIRRRYTILDLAGELGREDDWFAVGGTDAIPA